MGSPFKGLPGQLILMKAGQKVLRNPQHPVRMGGRKYHTERKRDTTLSAGSVWLNGGDYRSDEERPWFEPHRKGQAAVVLDLPKSPDPVPQIDWQDMLPR